MKIIQYMTMKNFIDALIYVGDGTEVFIESHDEQRYGEVMITHNLDVSVRFSTTYSNAIHSLTIRSATVRVIPGEPKAQEKMSNAVEKTEETKHKIRMMLQTQTKAIPIIGILTIPNHYDIIYGGIDDV